MISVEAVVFIAIGIAFLAGAGLLSKRKRKKKSVDQRLAEVFQDYEKSMEKFRN